MIDKRCQCQFWKLRNMRRALALLGVGSVAALAGWVACGPVAPRYTTPMQISLLEHFEVAERRRPSKRVADSSALKGSAVVQGCNSSLV